MFLGLGVKEGSVRKRTGAGQDAQQKGHCAIIFK